MNEERWNKLKEHAKKQLSEYEKLNNGISKIGKHVWNDVLNMMFKLRNKDSILMDDNKITRVEVHEVGQISLIRWDKKIKLSQQDNGRTLKILIEADKEYKELEKQLSE